MKSESKSDRPLPVAAPRRYVLKDLASLVPLVTGLIMLAPGWAMFVGGRSGLLVVSAALVVIGGLLTVLRVRADWRSRRPQRGLCAHCGYAMQAAGTVTFIRCPECGHWIHDPVE